MNDGIIGKYDQQEWKMLELHFHFLDLENYKNMFLHNCYVSGVL